MVSRCKHLSWNVKHDHALEQQTAICDWQWSCSDHQHCAAGVGRVPKLGSTRSQQLVTGLQGKGPAAYQPGVVIFAHL